MENCKRCGKRPAPGTKMCSTCLDKRRKWWHSTISNRRDQERANGRDLRRRNREAAIAAYGGRCVCCGLNVFHYLQLDHIDGGGTKDRLAHWGGGKFFAHLKRIGYPPGLQVLCANCHNAKTYFGGCATHPWTLRATP